MGSQPAHNDLVVWLLLVEKLLVVVAVVVVVKIRRVRRLRRVAATLARLVAIAAAKGKFKSADFPCLVNLSPAVAIPFPRGPTIPVPTTMPIAIPVIVRAVIAIVLIDQVPVQIPLRTAPAIPADVTLPAVRTRSAAAVPVPLVVVPFPKTQKDARLVRSTHPQKNAFAFRALAARWLVLLFLPLASEGRARLIITLSVHGCRAGPVGHPAGCGFGSYSSQNCHSLDSARL